MRKPTKDPSLGGQAESKLRPCKSSREGGVIRHPYTVKSLIISCRGEVGAIHSVEFLDNAGPALKIFIYHSIIFFTFIWSLKTFNDPLIKFEWLNTSVMYCSYNYNFPFCIFAVRRPNKDAFVPVHLYGQLTQHKEGFSLLQQQVVEWLCSKIAITHF